MNIFPDNRMPDTDKPGCKYKRYYWPFILLGLSFTTSTGFAEKNGDTGKKVEGNTNAAATPTTEPATTPPPTREELTQADTADFINSCKVDFHLPFLSKILFSLDGLTAWTVVPALKEAVDDEGKPINQPAERKLITYSIGLSSTRAVPIFGLRNTLHADLLTTLNPQGNAVSTANVITPPGESHCARGNFELVSSVSSDKGPIKRRGDFGVIPYYRTPVLLEPLSRKLLLLDTRTMQSRKIAEAPLGTHPVFIDPIRGMMTTWDPGARRLTSGSISGNKKAKTVKLQPGQQILQVNGRFAAIKMESRTNSGTIHEVANWTRVVKNGDYRFKLPEAYSVSQALVAPNFDRKIALITARDTDVQQKWQRAFLIDYKTGRMIREFKAPGTDYFSAGGISPNGKNVLLIQNSGKTSTADKIFNFDLNKETINQIALPVP